MFDVKIVLNVLPSLTPSPAQRGKKNPFLIGLLIVKLTRPCKICLLFPSPIAGTQLDFPGFHYKGSIIHTQPKPVPLQDSNSISCSEGASLVHTFCIADLTSTS